jgi:DNA recombination protein RmuC
MDGGAGIFVLGFVAGALLMTLAWVFVLRNQRRTREALDAQLREIFQGISADALRQNTESFLTLANDKFGELRSSASSDLENRQQAIDALIKPIGEALTKVDGKLKEIEKERHGHYEKLTEQLRAVGTAHEKLHSETQNLVKALRAPSVRGRWGEIQLKRVVEMAGMLDHCDFQQQKTAETDSGRLRPDMVVSLPAGKNVVVDAKAPLEAYLDSVEAADDAVRSARLVDHARQVRDHMTKLGSKGYWDQFAPAPEFVVMFLPGETFFSAALEHDPALIEYGVDQKVIPASPTTLIALLRAVAYGWRQEKLAENAQAISKLGRTLYERLATLTAHFEKLGGHLSRAVGSFNDAVGSLEGRVLVAARRFVEMGASSSDEIPRIDAVERTPRKLQASELETPASREPDSRERGSTES